MPTISITSPRPGTVVHEGQVTVTGTVTDRGGVEPVTFDSVEVQVDGGAPVRAALHYRHDPTLTVADFTASIAVTGAAGNHTLTAVVTDDNGQSTSVSETIGLDSYTEEVGAPDVLLDLRLPGRDPTTIDPADFTSLIATIQSAVAPASDLLAGVQKVLVGPNLAVRPTGTDSALLRLGLWIVDAGFHVDPPVAPFTLPRLPDAVATASLGQVPELPQPTGGPMQFAFSIPNATLAILADASLPVLQDAVDGVSGISISTHAPSTVVTTVTGSQYDVGFTMTLTDTLGLTSGTPQPMATTSADLGGTAGLLLDMVDIPLAMSAEGQAAQQGGVGAQVAAAMPVQIPIRESDLPSDLASLYTQVEFPVVALQWETFGVSGGIVGSGLVWIWERTQDEVALQIDGPSSLTIPHGEFDIATAFTVDVTDLVPDDGGFTATITTPYDLPPATSRTHTVQLFLGVLEQSANLPLDFRGPPRVNGHDVSGTSTWVLTVNAQETAASGHTLTASATKHVALTYGGSGSSGTTHNHPTF